LGQKRWYFRFSRPASGAKTAKCCSEKIGVRANLSSYDANALYKLIYSLLAKNYGIGKTNYYSTNNSDGHRSR